MKPRLTTLKPRLATSRLSLVPVSTARAGATPRLRGRAAVDRRRRWLTMYPLCCDCLAQGRTTAGTEVDHVKPLWQGGADDESNFATRCTPHHAEKTAREAALRGGGYEV